MLPAGEPSPAQRQGMLRLRSCRAVLPASRCGAAAAESPRPACAGRGWAARPHRRRRRRPAQGALPARQNNLRHGKLLRCGKCCSPQYGGTLPTAKAAVRHKRPGSAPPAGGTAGATPVQTAAWKRPFCVCSIPFYCTTAGGVCHKKAKKSPGGRVLSGAGCDSITVQINLPL